MANEVPESLGHPLPLVGNPYTLTKSLYTTLRPYAVPLLPYVTPALKKSHEVLGPATSSVLGKFGMGEFKGLDVNAKGNSVISVNPEKTKQTIIGGAVGQAQEFDVFAARCYKSVKDCHMPRKTQDEKNE